MKLRSCPLPDATEPFGLSGARVARFQRPVARCCVSRPRLPLSSRPQFLLLLKPGLHPKPHFAGASEFQGPAADCPCRSRGLRWPPACTSHIHTLVRSPERKPVPRSVTAEGGQDRAGSSGETRRGTSHASSLRWRGERGGWEDGGEEVSPMSAARAASR